MAMKKQEMQRIIRLYKTQTGETAVDMHRVAEFAQGLGWPIPTPVDPLDRLATQFSQAAREEFKHDTTTGRPYRVNHAIPHPRSDRRGQFYLWVDIDEAPRGQMLKSLISRRQQMVGDALQLDLDGEHWNNVNPDETPIQIPLDFTYDVEWAKNAPPESEEKAG